MTEFILEKNKTFHKIYWKEPFDEAFYLLNSQAGALLKKKSITSAFLRLLQSFSK